MSDILEMIGYIIKGSINTLELYGITILLSIPLGVLGALGKVSKSKLLSSVLGVYTWIFRGTPLMLQLFFIYFGLPHFLGITFDKFEAASITFVLNYAAYFIEIFRGGIISIDKGQYEAAKVLGMTYSQTMRRIILPQTIRRVLPATSNEAITLVKDTALVAAISMDDLLRNANQIVARDFTVIPFFIAGAIYLFLTSVIVWIFKKLEQKYSIYE
ncbi:MAG: polar amino acid transport system permease protein [Epulopiscium sp.]|uniref:ABC transporter permease subunit n=1 Tax=Defluviitalea raffinosedens TaxID=1450156 RepID=A0A7C8LHV7_9FIRM|nr:amino acid ABC transporter permease [Defluviitalea raffinosedens]MBZ4666994.1 amino acid transporter permease [Defluviitaleaceae bacterium]MDK2786800.1 polar amino acid transport system permease protein [Candidatus Epulonipiscium sp.]KAE9635644.1 ABC transporter permease subunit [Defluviitalea raffinosedens]MBM7684566.1 polar amino acid transport system permease protein [Defluviitalea raffinosedens]HHW68332.1 amino acid ABC transporter permease [Candidatus Epulonipiscium sp.]